MNGIFKRLLNVKGMVVESSRIVDGPLRPEPVLEVHVRAGKAAPRCSRCGRKRRGYGPGRRRAPLAAPGFRLLEGGAGRHDAARRLPRVRRGRRIGAVGGARQLEELLRGLLGRPIGRAGAN